MEISKDFRFYIGKVQQLRTPYTEFLIFMTSYGLFKNRKLCEHHKNKRSFPFNVILFHSYIGLNKCLYLRILNIETTVFGNQRQI